MVSTYFMPEHDYCPASKDGNANGGKPYLLNGATVWYRHEGKKGLCDWTAATTSPATRTIVTGAPVTTAPTTTGPAATEPATTGPAGPTTTAPTAPPAEVSFDSTVHIVVHAGTYMTTGKLEVLTAAYGNLTKTAFKAGDLSQGWAVSSEGYLRNLSGKGLFLASQSGCLAPMLETAAYERAKWTLKPTGDHWYEHLITSSCGNHLVGDETDVVSLAKEEDGAKWFILPVGKTQYQESSAT